MERRNGFLTFLTSLIPGVGYMYLGLMRKGIEAFLVFLLVPRILDIFTFGVVGHLVGLVIWCYTFIDTYHIAHLMDNGVRVEDTDFLLDKFENRTNTTYRSNYKNNDGNNNGNYAKANYNSTQNNNYGPNNNYAPDNNANAGPNASGDGSQYDPSKNYTRNFGIIIGWICVAGGGILLLNQLFKQLDIYLQVKSIFEYYVFPAAFIIFGVYLLYRHNKSNT